MGESVLSVIGSLVSYSGCSHSFGRRERCHGRMMDSRTTKGRMKFQGEEAFYELSDGIG